MNSPLGVFHTRTHTLQLYLKQFVHSSLASDLDKSARKTQTNLCVYTAQETWIKLSWLVLIKCQLTFSFSLHFLTPMFLEPYFSLLFSYNMRGAGPVTKTYWRTEKLSLQYTQRQ